MKLQDKDDSVAKQKPQMSRRLCIILVILIVPNVILALFGTSIIDILRFGAIIVFPKGWFPSYYSARYFGETQSYGYAKLGYLWGGKVQQVFMNTAISQLKENEDFTLFMLDQGNVFYGFSKSRIMTPELEKRLIHIYNNILDDKYKQLAREYIGPNGNGSSFFRNEANKHKILDTKVWTERRRKRDEEYDRMERREKYGVKRGYTEEIGYADRRAATNLEKRIKDASPDERLGFIRYLFSSTSTGDSAISDRYLRIYETMLTEDERYEARQCLREVVEEIDRTYQRNLRGNPGWRNKSYDALVAEIVKYKDADEQRGKSESDSLKRERLSDSGFLSESSP